MNGQCSETDTGFRWQVCSALSVNVPSGCRQAECSSRRVGNKAALTGLGLWRLMTRLERRHGVLQLGVSSGAHQFRYVLAGGTFCSGCQPRLGFYNSRPAGHKAHLIRTSKNAVGSHVPHPTVHP